MAPSIAARYLTRGLARAANNVHNKETARYITRRQLSTGEIHGQEAAAANNVCTKEHEEWKVNGTLMLWGLAACGCIGLWADQRRVEAKMQRKKAERDGTSISLG